MALQKAFTNSSKGIDCPEAYHRVISIDAIDFDKKVCVFRVAIYADKETRDQEGSQPIEQPKVYTINDSTVLNVVSNDFTDYILGDAEDGTIPGNAIRTALYTYLKAKVEYYQDAINV